MDPISLKCPKEGWPTYFSIYEQVKMKAYNN